MSIVEFLKQVMLATQTQYGSVQDAGCLGLHVCASHSHRPCPFLIQACAMTLFSATLCLSVAAA